MNSLRQYQNIQVMTADKVRLIIMMYDGVIRFNKCAQKAIQEKHIEARNTYINKSLAIVSELANSLNMEEGGEVARNLSRLYDFATRELTQANINNDSAALDTVNKIIFELKSGWEGIAAERSKPAVSQAATGISYGI
ncbi:MAG: flagellar export chaperone FliS [Deltaproteobacteria bacterium]|nr:flagellar export chaperone FliS [Deltaproteobacteria bacterium]